MGLISAPTICGFYFNSHAHVERDDIAGFRCWLHLHFNSHAHVERDLTEYRVQQLEKHFNSHAHVERDARRLPVVEEQIISTHTLMWSVTKDFLRYATGKIISTHTLMWSVTTLF